MSSIIKAEPMNSASKPVRYLAFSPEMLRAIFAGRKTQVRRKVSPQPDRGGRVDMGEIGDTRNVAYVRGARGGQCTRVECPHGWIGGTVALVNRQTGAVVEGRVITITGIRVERLQDISEEDAIAEGVELRQRAVSRSETRWLYWDYLLQAPVYHDARNSFASLWESTNETDAWDDNPWVWVLDFKLATEGAANGDGSMRAGRGGSSWIYGRHPMTDLITRARKAWCVPWLVEFDADDNEIPVTYDPCPPDVVATLLDVYLLVCPQDQQCVECNGGRGNHKDDCTAGAVEAAITRALEGK